MVLFAFTLHILFSCIFIYTTTFPSSSPYGNDMVMMEGSVHLPPLEGKALAWFVMVLSYMIPPYVFELPAVRSALYTVVPATKRQAAAPNACFAHYAYVLRVTVAEDILFIIVARRKRDSAMCNSCISIYSLFGMLYCGCFVFS